MGQTDRQTDRHITPSPSALEGVITENGATAVVYVSIGRESVGLPHDINNVMYNNLCKYEPAYCI